MAEYILKSPQELMEQFREDLKNPPKPKEVLEDIFPRPPEDPKKVPDDLARRINDILFASHQDTLLEAITADVIDAIVGILPGLDLLGITRVSDSMARGGKGKQLRTMIYSADVVIGILPVLGDVADALYPANTMVFIGDKLAEKIFKEVK